VRAIVETCVQRCGHDGLVGNAASQRWVRVMRTPVLVQNDPEGRGIAMCPNYGVNILPCTQTLAVHTGYSTFVRIGGQPVCLESVTGYTNGTPPGAVMYTVRQPGQTLVGVSA